MKVRCIGSIGPHLTVGQIYLVHNSSESAYYLTDNDGYKFYYYKEIFEIVKENEMKLDPVKLEKSIDAMTSVCEKGKKEIKNLLAEGFGVEFEKEIKPDHNQIYVNDKGEYGLLTIDTYGWYHFYNFHIGLAAATDTSGRFTSSVDLPVFHAEKWLKQNNYTLAYLSFKHWLKECGKVIR